MNINDLRAQVLKQQKAANNKVRRLQSKGVQISGTVYDPRRETGNIARYNSRQLSSYLSNLNDFMKRTNQFVPGLEGTPIRAGVWKNYQKAEKEYIAKVTDHYSAVKDTFVPRTGRTVEGFDKTTRVKRERGKGGVPRPLEQFSPVNLSGVVSEEKLRELQSQMMKKLNPEFVPRVAKEQKYKILQAVGAFGDPAMMKQAQDLSLDQVDTLFNYTDAPRDLFAGYRFVKLLSANKADDVDANIYDDDKAEAQEWLNWASNLPGRGKAGGQAKRKRE